MVPIKAHFLMFGQCRFDVNNKVLGTWIGAIWQHELIHVISELHCVCQCIATDHSREKCRSCAVWAGLLHVRVWSTPRPRAFVCGTFMADATGQDRTESRSRYDWLRAATSELWIPHVIKILLKPGCVLCCNGIKWMGLCKNKLTQ